MKFKPQFNLDLALSEEESELLTNLVNQWMQVHVQRHRDAYFDEHSAHSGCFRR